MTQVLRIGQGRTGYENSVGFLYSDENDFSGWSPFIDAVLKLVRGSRSITTTQEGRVQETFTVLGRLDEFVTVKRVQLDVSRLTQMFDLAGRLNTVEDETEQVWFVEKMEDEPQERRAIIYSGNISPVDDSVIDRQMSTGNALYVVTVERSRFWEYGKIVGTQGGAAGADLKVHGGRIIFTRDYASQGTVGRMTNLVIRPQHSYIKKMWLGIKPNRTGVINPRITIKSKNPSLVGGVYPLAAGVEPVVDADAADKRCIDINFRSEGLWQWKPRFRSELSHWNTATLGSDSDSATEQKRSAMLGNYRLIGRYKIMGDAAGIVGVRVGTGWRNPNNVSWGDRYFLEAIVNDEGTSQWHYFDFGSISIGGGLFSAEVRKRVMLDRFSIYVEAQWADGSHFTRIMFDDFILIPEDHYLYFNLEDEIGPKNRIEIFQNSKGRVHGYVAEHVQGDVINENIDYHRKIVASISEIEHKNWGVPWERESSLIGIVDRDDGYSSWTEAVIKVYIGAQKRTESIAHAYYNSNG